MNDWVFGVRSVQATVFHSSGETNVSEYCVLKNTKSWNTECQKPLVGFIDEYIF